MHFSWFHMIPGLERIPDHVLTAGFCTFLIIIMSLVAFSIAGDPQAALIPDRHFSARGFFEWLVESLQGMVESVLGQDSEFYVPIIGAMFLYILMNNLLGLFPGFSPATDNINTTLSVGMFVFVFYNIMGIVSNGMAYFKHFLGPMLILAPLMLPIEIISHIVRPLSLGVRLYGNMTGDHAVLSIFLNLVPIGVPMVFYLLGMFISFIQAFVFSLLSLVYIQMATVHDH